MANQSNLKRLTSEEARKIGKKGGEASVKARRERKTLREELLTLLTTDNNQNKISVALIKKAINGDTKAFEIIRDSIGEKPIEQIQNIEPPNIKDDI